MKISRIVPALLALVLLSPAAFSQDSSELASLMSKARRGNGIAQYNLGLAYAEGRGTAADPLEAFVWLTLARDNGSRGRALDNVLASFDRDTLALAEKRLVERRIELGLRPESATAENSVSTVEKTPPAAQPALAPVAATTPVPAAPKPSPGVDQNGLARLQAERDALDARNHEMNAELAALRAERDRANRASAAIQSEYERTRQSLQALQNAPKAAPDTAAIEQKDRELQATQSELQAARAFSTQVEDSLNRLSEEKKVLTASLQQAESARDGYSREFAAAKTQLSALEAKAAQSTAPAYPDLSGRVSELTQQLAAAKSATPAYPNLTGKVTELEAALVAAKNASPAYPNLSGKVRELESSLAQAEKSLAAKPAYPDLRSRVTELEVSLAAAKSAAPAYPNLSSKVTELETALAAARKAQPAYPDLSGKVAELEAALITAKNAAPAYPNLSGKVRELESSLAQAEKSLAAKPAVPDLRPRVTELEASLAATEKSLAVAKNAAPAYPDLSGKVADLEGKLAAKPAAPTYPDLSVKVKELEASVAALTADTALRQREATSLAAARAEAEKSRDALAKQFDDFKSSTAPALRERTNLQASVKMLESDKASLRRQAESAGTESTQLRTQVASLKEQLAAKPAAPSTPDLSGRVAELEQQLAAAKSAAPAYPNLTGKVAELEVTLASTEKSLAAAKQAHTDLAALTTERDQVRKQLADLNQSRDATQRELAAAQASSSKLSADLSVATSAKSAADQQVVALTKAKEEALVALVAAKQATPAYPNLSSKVAELETALLAAKNAKPAYPDLSGKVADLETQLSAAKNAPPAYPNLTSKVAELETTQRTLARELDATKSALAQTNDKLAAKPVAPAYPNLAGKVAELEAALVTAKNAAPTYPDLSGKVKELEGALAAAQQKTNAGEQARTELAKEFEDFKSSTTAAQRERTSLQASVKLLESDKASLRRQADTAGTEATQLRTQVASLKEQLAAKPAAPTYPDLSGRVAELEQALAAAQKATPAYPDLSGKVAELTAALAAASHAQPAYPNLTAKVTELEARLAAQPAAPAYPDLSGKVASLSEENNTLRTERERLQKLLADTGSQLRDAAASAHRVKELESQIADLNAQAGAAKREAANLAAAREEAVTNVKGLQATLIDRTASDSQHAKRIGELEAEISSLQGAVATKSAAPAYPNLASRVSELEASLAQAEKSLAAKPAYPDLRAHVADLETSLKAAQNAAPAYPDLSGRVRDLESKLADAEARRRAPAYPNLASRVSELEGLLADAKRQASDTEARLAQATSQPAPAVVEAAPAPDTSAIEKRLAETEDRLSTALRGYALLEKERDTLAAQNTQTNEALANEKNALSAKLTDAETRAAQAQAETKTLSENLAALQRSSGQTANDVSAVRTLVQQLQGANAVLAQENYQLKTILSRTNGTTAPAAPRAAPTAPAAGPRTHVVTSGDSLSKLSQEYYGTATRWQEIYNANRDILGPNGVLRIGSELRIP